MRKRPKGYPPGPPDPQSFAELPGGRAPAVTGRIRHKAVGILFDKRRSLLRQELPDGSLPRPREWTDSRAALCRSPEGVGPMLKSMCFSRPRLLVAGLVCLALSSGCGLARGSRWSRSSAPLPPSEPAGSSYDPREYSPSPIEPTPAERPAPLFPDDPPPPSPPPSPSTSEYLAPPAGQPRFPASQPAYSERPGLISPRNARRLPAGNERSASAQESKESRPTFEDGPVASRYGMKAMVARFQQVSARDDR